MYPKNHELLKIFFYLLQDEDLDEEFGDRGCALTQKRLWNLFENPHYSSAAKVLSKDFV